MSEEQIVPAAPGFNALTIVGEGTEFSIRRYAVMGWYVPMRVGRKLLALTIGGWVRYAALEQPDGMICTEGEAPIVFKNIEEYAQHIQAQRQEPV